MSSILQLICCLIISFLVWFIFGMILLSAPFGILGTDLFGPANTPVSTIAIGALIIGLVQEILMFVFLFRYESNTILSDCFYSFIATEIFLLLSMIVGLALTYLKEPIASGVPTTLYTYQDEFRWIYNVVFWYLILSLIFLIPSLIIGFAYKQNLNIVDSKILL